MTDKFAIHQLFFTLEKWSLGGNIIVLLFDMTDGFKAMTTNAYIIFREKKLKLSYVLVFLVLKLKISLNLHSMGFYF